MSLSQTFPRSPHKAKDAALAGMQRWQDFVEEIVTLYSHAGDLRGKESCSCGFWLVIARE